MIRSAVLKLTLWYLAIIMALSLSFSAALYRISSDELVRSLRRPPATIQFFAPNVNTYDLYRDQQLHEGERRLLFNLLLLNLLTLGVGGVASYLLARRTLRPIADAMEAQSRFTADASHELRTPLTAMQTEIEVALRNPSLTKADATDLLQSNLEEVAKLKALSDGLLRLGEQSQVDISKSQASLQAIATEAVGRVEKLARAKHITLKVDLTDTTVRGDEHTLTELAVILLDNAIKYSPQDTTVHLTTGAHASYGQLTITDQGAGIKAVDLPHIFDRFYRADQSRSQDRAHANGYGLGLSIAKKIIELHHGRIDVKTTLGKGSSFTMNVPVAPQ